MSVAHFAVGDRVQVRNLEVEEGLAGHMRAPVYCRGLPAKSNVFVVFLATQKALPTDGMASRLSRSIGFGSGKLNSGRITGARPQIPWKSKFTNIG